MSGEIVTGIQLGFYGLVVILFLVLLNKLERIGTLLAEANSRDNQIVTGTTTGTITGYGAGDSVTDEEIAAVLAVIAKLMPDKQVASVRMVSK
ncbi:MAG TPA: hypothetical protein VEC37_08870 [Bacillota bacterium]|nr:hypothetical protein [Bacillota bacterium]